MAKLPRRPAPPPGGRWRQSSLAVHWPPMQAVWFALLAAAGALEPPAAGTRVSLEPEGVQAYAVALAQGELLRVEVEAAGIDVALRLRSADGAELVSVDDSEANVGSEQA